MSSLKILHVIPSVNPHGGGTVAGLKQFIAQYASLGISAEVACCDNPNEVWLHSSDLPVIHALGPVSNNYSYTPKLLPWLRENMPRFDAVIIDGIWQYHSLAVHQASKKNNVPYFVFTHGMLGPWFKLNYPLKHLKKWLYWPWAEYWVLRKAKSVLFTCDEEKLLARESFWLYKANESVVGFGTSKPPVKKDLTDQKILSTHPELSNKRIILFVGRMHPIKGCDILIKSFSEVALLDDNIHLVMAGPDHENQISTLKKLTLQLGISHRVTWTGMLQGDAKWEVFHMAEVLCLPSHHENFGVVVAEALACGKPVLISNKVNIWREISAATAGFVANDTIEGTTRNLTQWLSLNENEYSQMSKHATECFENFFNIEMATKNLLHIIKNKK